MAWCQEFASQIHPGCDHTMVAAADSCSCPHCGVVCRGKFPACATVWAAGPVVNLVGSIEQLRPAHVIAELPSGTSNSAAVRPQPSWSSDGDRLPEMPANMSSILQSLRSELGALDRKVDRPHTRIQEADDAAVDLPEQISTALTAALHRERPALDAGGDEPRDQITSEAAALQAAIIGHLDARLEWLVKELSDRFVLLGNEIVRIKEHLTAHESDPQTRRD